ncbi:hypothetical protein DFH09DRAFT_1379429 [Mycena vulgaris]|nr:hypothetical protein DFH09DRAFT_1379429 [Mycena vulgaris]
MKLSIAALLATSILHPVALAALTRKNVVTNIGIVTTVSRDINTVVSTLSTSTTGPDVVTMGNTLVGQFNVIISNLTADTTAMKATPPFTAKADCDAIVLALDTFVKVHQDLLATVFGKHSILAEFAVTAPVAAVLQTLEGIIDTFAFAMIDLIPCGTDSVTNGKNGLDASVEKTIKLYQQICVPFPPPLYPTLMPLCVGL